MLSQTKYITLKKSPSFTCAQILFFGPLYSLFRLTKTKIQLRLHLGADCYIHIPKSIIPRVFKKRLVLFGDKERLSIFVNGLMNLRLPNIYTGTGLRKRSTKYYTKAGKIRRR